MRIAVTGGNGDLGSVLVPYLLSQGHDVVTIDRSVPPPGTHPSDRTAHYMVADVTDFGQFAGCLHGCDALVHLAAIRAPWGHPDHEIYRVNTIGSYNALSAASLVGIERVCLASSINAIGGVFSRQPHYDYFPLDEAHPSYTADPYSLSKWVLEQQADAFVRRFPKLRVASLRFHWILPDEAVARQKTVENDHFSWRHLWAFTDARAAARACLLTLTADFSGHEAFYIVAPRTAADELSRDLAQRYFPETPIRTALTGHAGFFSTAKAERILGWKHDEE
jgi:nucleoside-diphosphate-sugar epimerase